MEVKLLAYTLQPVEVLKTAFSQCYQKPARIETIRRHIQHQSVFEHVVYTFQVHALSRVAMAQLTRHRLASYTIQSHRYTTPTGCVCPDSVFAAGEKAVTLFEKAVSVAAAAYDKLIEMGVPREDARYILPEGSLVDLVFTMNLREIIHFCKLRCDHKAQWEIRELAHKVLDLVVATVPELEQDIRKMIGGVDDEQRSVD